MSREIKFRIWGPKLKKFIYVGPTNYYCAEYSGLLFKAESDGFDQTYHDGYIAEEDYPNHSIQQYTGLKDKNGKEIYEGDIVKLTDNSVGVIEYNTQYLAYMAKEVGFKENDFNNPTNKDILEVIGNIYENPELLENR